MGEKINTYFEERAKNYLAESNRGIWSHFRQKERDAISRLLEAKAHSSLLDLGSGAGYYSLYFKENFKLEVLAIDSSAAMVEQLNKLGIPCRQLSIENLGVSQLFDNALAAGVLEFVEAPEKFFQQIGKNIKPGGRLVLLIPASGFFGWGYKVFHSIAGCPVFIRHSNEYIKLATASGFKKISSENPTVISKVICFEKI